MILFDLDGPILDVSEKYYRVYADWVRAQGGEPVAKERYWQGKRQRLPDRELLAATGLAAGCEAYWAQRREVIETPPYLAFDRLWEGVEERLRRIAAVTPVVLVTLRRSPAALAGQLEQLGVAGLFARVLVGSGRDGAADRAAIKVGLVRGEFGEGLGARWFIGDTETDIVAGRRLGLATAAVTFGIRDRARLEPFRPTLILEERGAYLAWLDALFPG